MHPAHLGAGYGIGFTRDVVGLIVSKIFRAWIWPGHRRGMSGFRVRYATMDFRFLSAQLADIAYGW
jgi:hypothetical protein